MLYVQDRMNHTLAVLENYYNDTHTLILESGVSTYNFTIPKNQDGSEYLVRGNYVVLADDKGQGWKFTIMATDETHSSLDVECEDLGLELLNKVRNSWASPGSAQPFKFYFDKVVRDTGWTLGVNEISNLSRTLSWDGRDTALKRLLSICTQFDHAEIEFKVEFKNMQVTKQVVNVYKQRGANRSDVQLVYGDTVNDIRKTTEIRELATAIQGVGGVIQKDNPVEGEPEEHVDFASLTYDDGEYFTPAGDPFLYARVANQQFNIKDTYLEDFYDYDTQDAQELLNRTLTQLKERCQPKVNYEVDLAKVDSSLNLGDTVTIIDHDYKPELLLSGRVLQIEKSYTDSSKNKATFGNFLILYSNISDQLRALQEQMNSLKPVANYMWLRYAKDDKGNGMTAMPTSDTKYVAMLVNKKTGVPSDNPADYAGHWKLIQGADGKDGIPGATGADGKTSYTHFAYANNVSGTADFSLDDPTGRSYMGVYSDFTKADSNNPSDYVWSLTKGDTGPEGMQGAQGPKGDIGIPGKPGADGKTSYTHVAYADNDEGGGFSQFPANKAYMGWYTDFTQADSTDITKYAWSLIKGRDGLDGAQGIAGPKGADGKTSYTHIAYADAATGGGFSQLSDGKKYIGMYVDFTENDSSDPNKYAWSLIKGADGKDGLDGTPGKDGIAGKDGVGVKATAITYAQSTSGTTPPATAWAASVPTLIKGQYLWTKTVWTYTDSSAETGYTVSYNAKDGNTGADGIAGKDGVGIESTVIEYAVSSSGITKPTTGWSALIPSVAPGQFMWTRTTWRYTDSTNEVGYSVAQAGTTGPKGDTGPQGLQGLQGTTGNQGIQGPKGLDGKSSYTHIAYGTSNSGAGFTQTPSTSTTYIGMYVDQTATDSIDPNKYAWSLIKGADGAQGTPGAKGADGKTPYFHSAWANSVDGKTGFSTTDSVNKSYLGTYTDFTVADSADPTKYAWSLIKGADGVNGKDGIPGKPGADGKIPYFHTAWADSADGKNGFSLTDSANKSYLGTYTDFTKADSTDTTKYAWSLIKGRDGSNGAPGKAGTDGKTPYFHQAWADSKDGKINFSTTDPTSRGYLGTYSDFTQADSNDPTKYFWVELVGAIEIGGRNLVSGTNQEYAMGYGIPTTSWRNGYAYLKLPTNVINGEILPQGSHTFWYTMTQGATYTQAIWFETDATVKDLSGVQITWYTSAGHDNQPARVQKLGQNSYKIVSTYTWPGKSDNNVRLFDIENLNSAFGLSTGTYLKFGKLKLEIGNKATDWSPAPEDTQGQIDTINKGLSDTNGKIAAVTKIDRQATAPTNPKSGDQWWVLSKDPTTGKDAIEAFKQWNGTQWEDAPIQQSAMNIGTLNGNVINGATINGSEFTNNFDFTGIDKIHFQGVTRIKDGAVNITWKIPENNQTGSTTLNASGLMSVIRDSSGTALRTARLQMGQLGLSDLLSGTGSSAKFLTGTLDAQDTIRNSIATPTYYTNGWAPWTDYWPFLLKRNGRQITISGYLKNTGSSSSDFSIGASILRLPDWGEPFTPAIIPGTRQNAVTGSTGDAPVVLGLDKSGILHIESSGFKVGQWLSFSASYFGKDLS